MMSWPIWKKLLFKYSIVLIALALIGSFATMITASDMGAYLLFFFITLPIIGIIVGLWMISFFVEYLKKKHPVFARVVLIIGLLATSIFATWLIIEFLDGRLSEPLLIIFGVPIIISGIYFTSALR